MFALVERVPWSQVNNNCTSNCAYIKMKDLMDEMQNATNASEGQEGMENIVFRKDRSDHDEMLYMLLGEDNWMKMQMKMMINRLPKYCFQPSDNEILSMCAALDMDMDVMEMIYGEWLELMKY